MKGDRPTAADVLEVRPGPRSLALRRRPLPPLRSGEVLVAVDGAALGDAEAREVAEGEPGAGVGHALVGRVAAAGDGAIAPGTMVVLPSRPACGVCAACRRGRAEACLAPGGPRPGALASHVVVAERDLVPLVGGLADVAMVGWRLAAAGSALLLAYHGLARVGLAPGEVALFVGVDAVSLCGVQVAEALGAIPVVVDPSPARLAVARRLGARAALPCLGVSPPELVEKFEGLAAEGGWSEARRTVVTRARGAAGIGLSLALAQPGGTLVILGASTGVVPADQLVSRGATVVGLEDGHPDLLTECLALIARGSVSLESVTRPVAATEVESGLQRLRQGDRMCLSVVQFDHVSGGHDDQ